jgi:small multidrug resistance pump
MTTTGERRLQSAGARVVKQVDTRDLKSLASELAYRFESGPGHHTPIMQWILLALAIVAEVIATSTLKSTEGFTRLWPSVVVVICYETAFILLSLTLKKIPIGIVYAVWSGAGVALITLVAWVFLDQPLGAAELAGLALIVGGVVVINVFSKSTVE